MATNGLHITHYDLFAGIGGFSLAIEEVFSGATTRHIFCEWESFPTAVLKRHWPDGEYWGDIADLVTHTERTGLERAPHNQAEGYLAGRRDKRGDQKQDRFTIVTGGFPCQPFSAAGRRKGTADDRYQWPNMFAVIRNTKPEWVIAENVRGLVTWNEGLVLETVCADLEAEGYEVQPFIIPAVAVGAPHRRDRVWIIGHLSNAEHYGQHGTENGKSVDKGDDGNPPRPVESFKSPRPDSLRQGNAKTSANADTDGLQEPRPQQQTSGDRQGRKNSWPDWSRDWREVAFATCNAAVDDGLPRLVDGVPMSRSKWRQNSLKAYGNGIVSQVAMNIMQAIKEEHYA